jgi:hypothetical protein
MKWMEKFLKIKELWDEKQEAERAAAEAKAQSEKEIAEAKEAARLANLGPKQLATENKEPWVAVLATQVNKENIRNGFFELDWNEYFIRELRLNGYQGDSEEEIVDKWFTELCRNVGMEQNIDMSRRGSGYINVNNLGNGRTERG